MKGNLAMPGGLSTSKPMWSNTSGCPTTSAFFSLVIARDRRDHEGKDDTSRRAQAGHARSAGQLGSAAPRQQRGRMTTEAQNVKGRRQIAKLEASSWTPDKIKMLPREQIRLRRRCKQGGRGRCIASSASAASASATWPATAAPT